MTHVVADLGLGVSDSKTHFGLVIGDSGVCNGAICVWLRWCVLE